MLFNHPIQVLKSKKHHNDYDSYHYFHNIDYYIDSDNNSRDHYYNSSAA